MGLSISPRWPRFSRVSLRRLPPSTLLAGAALATLWLAGCASVPPPDALLSGVALTRLPVSLPPDSVFEAALLQWSGDGAPPVVLARQRIDDAGSPPYALLLPYRQVEITPGLRHGVRASVSQGDGLILHSPEDVVVLLDPALRRVDVPLAPVAPAQAQAEVALQQTWWRLVGITDDGPPVGLPAAQAQPAHLLLQSAAPRVSGSGGCNRFDGNYRLQGQSLRFFALSASLRLCLDGGLSEAGFFERLSKVASYWQKDRRLELRGNDGKTLLKFEAQENGLPPLAPRPDALRR